MKLELRNVFCGYGHLPVLKDVNFAVESGEICCLLGPNGVGKTTLFKTILKLIKKQQGEILIDGENIERWSPGKMARHMAYVSQFHVPPFPYKVRDVVLLGRINSISYFGQPTARDYQIAEEAMIDMGIDHLHDKSYTDISGGERQLVMLARALAQEPGFLVLDEPTASLDYGNMVRVMSKICDLRDKGIGIIMTTHTPDHAFMCQAKVVLLQRDEPLLFGFSTDIITEKNLKRAYGISVKLVEYSDHRGRFMRMCSPIID
ncbi:MAG: ABC transporter ATP-binding protein [Bacillota bacterium]|nr:ABC transporter ATP-binding protein [Bacillota bacterium]